MYVSENTLIDSDNFKLCLPVCFPRQLSTFNVLTEGLKVNAIILSRGAEVSPSGDYREGSCRGRVLPLRRGWTGPLRIKQVTSGHAWWLKTCGGANMGQQWGNWEVGSLSYLSRVFLWFEEAY